MIYLIKSSEYKELSDGSIESFFLLKIGYTEDSNKNTRFSQYRMHNPTCKILYEVPGLTEEDEKNVQYRFRKYLYPEYGMEWFEYNKEIVDFFSDPNVAKNIKSLPKCPVLEHRELTKLKKEVKVILEILNGIDKSIDIKYLYKEVFNRKLRSIDLVYEFLELSIDKNILDKCKYLLECRETSMYCKNPEVNKEVSKFLNEYQELKTYYDKIKLLCEYGLSEQSIQIVLGQLGGDEIASHYIALGPERLKKLYYNKTNIKKELGIVVFSKELLVNTILSRFIIGDRIPNSDIKDTLGNLYESINYTATPKAIDLEEYFEVKKCKITLLDKTRVNALEIVGIKPEYQFIYNNLKIINKGNNIL